MNIVIQERDYAIVKNITKYRFLLGNHIRILCDFPSQRCCDRRLKKLADNNYIVKKHIIYGVPYLYFVTFIGKKVFCLDFFSQNVRIETILHDIHVVDTAIFYNKKYNIADKNIVSERQLKHDSRFGDKTHKPDLVINHDNKKICVEIELSLKQFEKLEKNAKDNFIAYDNQIWVVDEQNTKIIDNIAKLSKKYPNIEILGLSEVTKYVKTL